MVNLPSFVKEILQLPKQISDPLPRDKLLAVTLEEWFNKALGGIVPQETIGNVWRYFGLSQLRWRVG